MPHSVLGTEQLTHSTSWLTEGAILNKIKCHKVAKYREMIKSGMVLVQDSSQRQQYNFEIFLLLLFSLFHLSPKTLNGRDGKEKVQILYVHCVCCKHPWETGTWNTGWTLQLWHVNLEHTVFSFIPQNPCNY